MHKITYFFNPLFLPHVVQAVGWHAHVGGYVTKANGKFFIGGFRDREACRRHTAVPAVMRHSSN